MPAPLPQDERAWLCRALLRYMERHPERRAVAEKIYAFVTAHADCFQRTQKLGHITGSAWLLNPAGDKALLTLHRNLKRWMQLGGHSDGDPNTLAVALREATEESGIEGIIPLSTEIMDVDIHRIPDRPAKKEPAHWHYDIRFLMQAPHENYTISEESDDLAWCSCEELNNRADETDEAVRRLNRLWAERTARSVDAQPARCRVNHHVEKGADTGTEK